MSLSVAPPAAASPATTAGQGATAGATGQAGGAGDSLGLFGQLLAMLGIDPKAAGDLDPKALAQTLGKTAAKADDAVEGAAGGAIGKEDDKSKDDAKTDTTNPVDPSALIAALLAAAQQTAPAVTPTASADSSSTEGDAGIAADGGRSISPVQARIETLMAALTGQAQPETTDGKTPLTAQGAAAELALASPKIDTPAQPQAPAPEPSALVPDRVAPQAGLPNAADAAIVQVQVAASAPKIAAPLASRPTSAGKPAASASSIKAQGDSKTAPSQDEAAALHVPPTAESAKAPPSGKAGADLAALPGDPLAKRSEKPVEDESQPTLAAGALPQAATSDAASPLAAQIAVRGSPETVAKLAAQIVKKLEVRTTRFEVGLDPIGLGRVDVKVEIGANGKLHAQMSFDNANAANDLRGRAGQLRDALEQAGFDLKGGSLSFDVAGQGGQGRGQQQQQQGDQPRFSGAAGVFEAALNLGDTPITAPVWAKTGAASGVDIRI